MGSIKAPYVAGFFDDPHDFMKAAEASTARGHVDHDAYLPYPVHGFDHKLGYKRSWIGRIVLFMLLFGAFCGFFMQYYMMKVDWPIILAGKAYNSWPAYVVITFEGGILAGALTNFVVCLFVACKLAPKPFVPVIKEDCTDDVFALCIPVEGNGSAEDLKRFLEEQGADDIALYEMEGDEPAVAASEEADHA